MGVIDFRDVTDHSAIQATTTAITGKKPIITHIITPEPLRAVYMTACTASEKRLRNKTISLFAGTELNAVVIDLKDYTGTISYASTTVVSPKGHGCRIYDLPEFLAELHKRNIYTIARVTVFQDPAYAASHPELAVKKVSEPDIVWRDKNGLAYIDPGAFPYWDYIVSVAKEGYAIGFDEINFDYIRFPSDGNLSDVVYSWSMNEPKADVIKNFFIYLRERLASTSMPLSADLFGLTTSAEGDLGIGQTLDNALSYFDYVSPMVYPSHFARGFMNYGKPAEHPYDVVKYSMTQASLKALAASSSPDRLRPWLQAFDLGAVYTPAMVRAEIQAVYDAGLTSWMLWNAGSVYDKKALATTTDN